MKLRTSNSEFPASRLGRRHSSALPLIALLYLLGGCAGGNPTFKADITRPDGKTVYRVAGVVEDNKTWLERYMGPAGQLISGIGYLAGQLLTGGTLPTP